MNDNRNECTEDIIADDSCVRELFAGFTKQQYYILYDPFDDKISIVNKKKR